MLFNECFPWNIVDNDNKNIFVFLSPREIRENSRKHNYVKNMKSLSLPDQFNVGFEK